MTAGQPWVAVWFFDLAAQGPRLLEIGRARQLLEPGVIERSSRFASTAQAERFLASRAALRLVLAEYGDGHKQFDVGPHGKPTLGGGLGFNLSRTDEAVIIAVSNGEVGVDIERRRPVALTDPLIAEVSSILPRIGWPADADTQLRTWTVLEAWVKYHGLAMPRLLDERALASRMIEEIVFRDVELTSLVLPPHICGTLCTGREPTIRYESSGRLTC